MIGRESFKNKVKNVLIDSNIFKVTHSSNTIYLSMIHSHSNVMDCTFSNNIIDIDIINEGIVKFICNTVENVNNNKIRCNSLTKVDTGIYKSKKASGNTIENIVYPIRNTSLVTNNIIIGCRDGIKCIDVDNYAIADNIIYLDHDAKYTGGISVESVGIQANIINNIVYTKKDKDFAIYIKNGNASVIGNTQIANPTGEYKRIESGSVGYSMGNLNSEGIYE